MTEKRKPTYDLDAIKAAFGTVDTLSITGSAVRTAAALGFGRNAIVATTQAMQRTDFLNP
jgi:motility quorum-sensing regulator/GCU-specific mRNA interferase toxin